jgi:hypothetical protein
MLPCTDCGCVDCACTDDYSSSGTGGAGRPCPFTGGDSIVISGGELPGAPGTSIVFTNGPDTNTVATTVLTIIAQPSDSDGPSSIRLRAGIQGGEYVYGLLSMTAGNVTLSIGNQGGEFESNVDAVTGGISGFATLTLCWKPPVQIGTVDGAQAGADEAFGDPEWESSGVVENILTYNDGTSCARDSLGDNETSGPIGVNWYPFIEPESTITEIRMVVNCRENASPANGIEDESATVTAGSVGLSDKATGTAIPAPSFAELQYSWTGGDLTGVTAADINLNGMVGVAQFHMPLGSGGGTTVDVEGMQLAILYETPDKTPGRLTFTYTNGATTACVTAQTTQGEGGGFPGVNVISDTWDITSTDIDCNSATCAASCGDPVDCATAECCDESGSAAFTDELMVSGFTTSGGSPCCTDDAADYALEFDASPQGASGGCSWINFNTDCDDNSFQIRARIWRPLPGVAECYWDVVVSCFDGINLSFSVVYRSAVIASLDCDNFPITLNKLSEINPDGVTFPSSITLDNT